MRFALAVGLLLWATVCLAEPWDIPPPPRGQWVLDRTGKVSPTTLSELNRLADALDASGAGQLGVLVIDSTGGSKPRDFATGVFNNWGVGHGGSNDGVLLFFAVKDRKSEIILGDGSKVSSAQTDVVMRDDVVANMKKGDLDGALREAARSLDGLLRRASGRSAPTSTDNTGLGPDAYVTPTQATPLLDPALAPFADGSRSFPERSPRTWVVDLSDVLTTRQHAQLDVAASDIYSSDKGRIFFLLVNSAAEYPTVSELVQHFVRQVEPLAKAPLAVIALDKNGSRVKIYLPDRLVRDGWERQELGGAEQALRLGASADPVVALIAAQRFVQQALTTGISPRPMSAVLEEGIARHQTSFGLGGGVLGIGGLLMLKRWNRRRTRRCEKCQNPRQRLGEEVEDKHLDSAKQTEESVGSVDYDVWWCGRCQDVLVLRYGAFFTSYSDCPQCNAKTKRSSTTTETWATEYSCGSERIDETCANCSFTNSFTRTTAMLSSSSSSDSSSSSSDSSFGGGDSSGGGSSGSW
jgi:uncharacterized membrane protein YgcG